MKQVFWIVRYNFFGFFRNPKVIFTFLLEFVLSFLLTGKVMTVMENYHTPVQAVEPFLWTFGDGTAVLLSSLLLLLLFSDLPKMTTVTPYQLIRTTKKKWLLAQFLYVVLVTVLYTVLMLFFTSVLCMQNSYSGNLWSETAAMLGYSSLGQKPAGALYSESYGKHFSLWMHAAGFSSAFLLFPYIKFYNSCGKSLRWKSKRQVLGLFYSDFWLPSGSQSAGVPVA